MDEAKRPLKFRGPKSFYFRRRRFKLDSLRARMAERRTWLAGGSWNGETGDGVAWHKIGDRLEAGWFLERRIKAGQWSGPWIRKMVRDI
jgi:hypothetical protein